LGYILGAVGAVIVAGLAFLGVGLWSSARTARPREERYDREKLS
jgi:hypothetical protein